MFVTLKMIVRTLILPPASPLLLSLVGAWLLARHASGRARTLGIALLATGLGSLWVLSTPVVADLFARAAEREPVLDLARAQQAQAIVILGGGGGRHSAPEYGHAPAAGGDLLERVAYGAYLAKRTGLPVLVTGQFAEAEAMHTSLAREFGVAARWVESHSRDTFENAEFSARLLQESGISRIVLVTGALHEYRAAREFEASGFMVVAAPTGVWVPAPASPMRYLPSAAALKRSTEALYELIGEVARRVFQGSHLRRHGS